MVFDFEPQDISRLQEIRKVACKQVTHQFQMDRFGAEGSEQWYVAFETCQFLLSLTHFRIGPA
jgi:hypothetical protein